MTRLIDCRRSTGQTLLLLIAFSLSVNVSSRQATSLFSRAFVPRSTTFSLPSSINGLQHANSRSGELTARVLSYRGGAKARDDDDEEEDEEDEDDEDVMFGLEGDFDDMDDATMTESNKTKNNTKKQKKKTKKKTPPHTNQTEPNPTLFAGSMEISNPP